MEIKNPRRILFIGPPDSGVLSILKDLTGSAPDPRIVPAGQASDFDNPNTQKLDPQSGDSKISAPTAATTAGLSHSLSLANTYYTAQVPIWVDETTAPEEWKQDFLGDEAGEVIRAIGAWVLCFRLDASEQNVASTNTAASTTTSQTSSQWAEAMMTAVKEVIDKACGGFDMWDGVLLCVGIPSYIAGTPNPDIDASDQPELQWEDLCWDHNFEFIDTSPGAGEKSSRIGESAGVKRLKEALEANDWNVDDEEEDAEDFGDFVKKSNLLSLGGPDFQNIDSGEDTGFAMERHEMEQEMLDLKMALNESKLDDTTSGDEAEQLEEFERTMGKLLAVKDMTAHMSPAQRKKVAAKAMKEVMDTM